MVASLDHEPYLGAGLQAGDWDVRKGLGLLAAVVEPGERALAVFRSEAFRYRFLVVTSKRVFGLDVSHTGNPEKAPKQVVSTSDIHSVSGFILRRRLRVELTNGTTEEFGGLAGTEIDQIVAWVEGSSSPERIAELQERRDTGETQRQATEKAFANVPVYGERVNKPTKKEIAANCRDGEVPRFIIGSSMSGALAVFDDRCVLVKKGAVTNFMAGSLGGGRVATFMYPDITGVEYNSGLVGGVLEILTPSYAGTSNKDYWRGTLRGRNANADDPYTLSNTLPLPKSVYAQVRAQVEELKRLVGESKRTQHSFVQEEQPRSSDSAGRLASELERLAELKERGLLDEDEFKAAKRALIENVRDA